MLNHMTLLLSPVALAVVLAYSYMKRVTRWSHLVLGLALGIAPAAAWIAVRGSLDVRAVLLTGIVLLWVGGFDVLYACQDFEHDRRCGAVQRTGGVRRSRSVLDRTGHAPGDGCVVALVVARLWLGSIALAGMVLVMGLLAYEHAIVSPRDLRRMNAAFFTLNGVISVVFFAFVAADVLLRR